MSLPVEKLQEILVSGNYVNEENFEKVASLATKRGEALEITLVREEIIKDEKFKPNPL